VLLDDAVDGGEAEAGAFAYFLGGEEGLEEFVEFIGLDAGAIIANRQADKGAFAGFRVALDVGAGDHDRDGADGKGAAAGHGVAGIDREVHDDLLHHRCVCFDGGEFRARLLRRLTFSPERGGACR